MADMTAVEMSDLVLEHMGIKPAGQAASAEDASLMAVLIAAAHARLRTEGLAPYSVDSIPSWAQIPFRDYVAGDAGPTFGRSELKLAQPSAEEQMRRQVAMVKPPLTIIINSF